MNNYQCPCCGYYTYSVPADEDCGYICPVCFWENDPFTASDNEPSDSNHGMTLKQAKSNYLKFGACEKEMLRHVRPPKDHEKDGEGFSADEASDEDRRKEIYGS